MGLFKNVNEEDSLSDEQEADRDFSYKDEDLVNTLEEDLATPDIIEEISEFLASVEQSVTKQSAVEKEKPVKVNKKELVQKQLQQEKEKESEESVQRQDSDFQEEENETIIITEGTAIKGNISTDGSLDVMGTVEGDIDCFGCLTIKGTVIGNSIAAEVYADTPHLKGNINSEGNVTVTANTEVVGNIIASSCTIQGTIQGEIHVDGPVMIEGSAVIKGNITAKTVQINNGAIVEGFCSFG